MNGPSRRGLLTGAVAAVGATVLGLVAVEEGVLPGRVRVDTALGRGRVDVPPPGGAPAAVTYATFRSARRGQTVRWGAALPDGIAPGQLPVVLVLHGRGGDAREAFGAMGLAAFLADHVRQGGRPLALVSVDGGEAYWHPRASGDDPLGMLTDELLPRLRAQGLTTARVGALGWSMGGYGALLLARQSARAALAGTTVGAAVASSPALFASAGQTAAGAFDGPPDFARWGALAGAPDVGGTALSVSCGTSDPFAGQTRRYRAAVSPPPAGGISAGRHEFGYWRSLVPAQLRFLAERL